MGKETESVIKMSKDRDPWPNVPKHKTATTNPKPQSLLTIFKKEIFKLIYKGIITLLPKPDTHYENIKAIISNKHRYKNIYENFSILYSTVH